MKLESGWLTDAQQRLSPHADERPADTAISVLIVHGISLPAGEFGGPYIDELFMGTLDQRQDPRFAEIRGLRVSAHALIRRDGELIQYVSFDRRAWHAGQSAYAGRRRCNDFAIGVELEGTDHTPYTKEQYRVLAELAQTLIAHYPELTAQRIVGHQHIAPVRKTDPGPAFDWSYFRQLLTR